MCASWTCLFDNSSARSNCAMQRLALGGTRAASAFATSSLRDHQSECTASAALADSQVLVRELDADHFQGSHQRTSLYNARALRANGRHRSMLHIAGKSIVA